MKHIVGIILIATLLSSCMISTMQAPQKPSYPEMVQINVYDNTRWNQGKGDGNDNQFITESTPKGQSVHNWKEIITFEYYSKRSGRHSIEKHLTQKEKILTNACPNIKFTTLSKSDIGALYQWSINDCKGQEDQFEVARYVKTKYGIHRISYSQKNQNPTLEEFNKWLFIIKDAKVVKI